MSAQSFLKGMSSPGDVPPVLTSDKADCERCALVQLRSSQRTSAYIKWLKIVAVFILAFLGQRLWLLIFPSQPRVSAKSENFVGGLDDLCPQVAALMPPQESLMADLDETFGSDDFKLKVYELLGGAVRIPTESYDNMGPVSEDDPEWNTRGPLLEYLESSFPNVHSNLTLTKINTYGLLYEWKGSSDDLKPLLLLAHSDVVPVNEETLDQWTYPPYSGDYDGERIWGRGSCDDKAPLIGSLAAVEELLGEGFMPARTVLLAYGFDEEIGGFEGAMKIAEHLLETRGPDSIGMIVDEGSPYNNTGGVIFAVAGTAEKGYMDIRIDLSAPGGHSSMPPAHTGIGILSEIITELEADPHKPELVRGTPYYQWLECRARYDADFPGLLRELVLLSQTSDESLRELESLMPSYDSLFYALSGTTQAVDLIGGGVKVNVLPETSWSVVNHRIAVHSSVSDLTERFTNIVLPVAEKHNMALDAFGNTMGSTNPWGNITLSGVRTLEPAPLTPTSGSGPYELLSGTIRSTLQTHLRTDGYPRASVVSPGLMTGNTGKKNRGRYVWMFMYRDLDTRHFWNLTKHLFRYNHWDAGDYQGIHTINEAIRAEGFLEQIRFFTMLILNADTSDLL